MSVFKGEAVTGELSKLLDEIKLCQEKEYSFEDLSHTISDHFLDAPSDWPGCSILSMRHAMERVSSFTRNS